MSVIEASACEKPVIVLDVGGLAESVKNGVSGFVVLPGDPEKIEKIIKLVLFDKDLQINIGKAGRTRAKRLHNLEHNENNMIAIYQNMLNSYHIIRPRYAAE